MRLNPIAAQRAAEKASTTSATARGVTRVIRDAASTPRSANGKAKRVCGSLTKLTYRTRSDSPPKVWASRGGRACPELCEGAAGRRSLIARVLELPYRL